MSCSAEELEWIAGVAAGDRLAFERLYERYAPRVFWFVQRMIRDEARAEEATNDVMVEIWKSAGRFEGRSSLSSWILGIARHRALNAIRGLKLGTTGLDAARDVADPSDDAERRRQRGCVAARLRRALGILSREHREVIELGIFQEMSYREIAQIAGCPENTVKTRMFHAKRRLRPLLCELGFAGGNG